LFLYWGGMQVFRPLPPPVDFRYQDSLFHAHLDSIQTIRETSKTSQVTPRSAPQKPLALHAINVNTATVEELVRLPRIGPRIAQRIVDYRRSHGPFRSLEALTNVKGIGPRTLEKIKPYLRLN